MVPTEGRVAKPEQQWVGAISKISASSPLQNGNFGHKTKTSIVLADCQILPPSIGSQNTSR